VDLFEYQGKQYFAKFGIPVSAGGVAVTVDEAVKVADASLYPVVVKAQVQVGGRGKAGGIKLANNADEVRLHAGNILGMDIKGHVVKRIWVEHASDIDEEYYVFRVKPGRIIFEIDGVDETVAKEAFEGLRLSNRKVKLPGSTLAVVDHNVPTTDRSKGIADKESAIQVETLSKNCKDFGIEFFGLTDKRQGIVHVIGPEQGFTQPGMTIVCGDSHTSTHGAFGAFQDLILKGGLGALSYGAFVILLNVAGARDFARSMWTRLRPQTGAL